MGFFKRAMAVAVAGWIAGAGGVVRAERAAPQNEHVPAAAGGRESVPIDTSSLSGAIDVAGASVKTLSLKAFRQNATTDSEALTLLTRQPGRLWALETGWAREASSVGPQTGWRLERGAVLKPGAPVLLAMQDATGLQFTREFRIDERNMLTVIDTVRNHGVAPRKLHAFGLLSRQRPEGGLLAKSRDGAIGLMRDQTGAQSERVERLSYLAWRQGQSRTWKATGGWSGLTQDYWLTALAPASGEAVTLTADTAAAASGFTYRWRMDFADTLVAPGEARSQTVRAFLGPKQLSLLEHYEREHGMPKLDQAIGWGGVRFLAKPFIAILASVSVITGSFGVAIVVLTILVRLALFPLSEFGAISTAKAVALKPKIDALKKAWAGRSADYNREVLALYKRENVRPLAGFIPILLSAPIFVALYVALSASVEMRHAPFLLGITDLSAPDPMTLSGMLGLSAGPPAASSGVFSANLLRLGPWALIYAASAYIAQIGLRPIRSRQAFVQATVIAIGTIGLSHINVGMSVYYIAGNILSIFQRSYIERFDPKRGVLVEFIMLLRREATSRLRAVAAPTPLPTRKDA